MDRTVLGLDLDVEVLIGGDWIRSRAHESRPGADGRETLVSWSFPDESRPATQEAWVRHSHIRAIHLAD